MSNFSFPHSVFKRLVLQTCKNKGLFGKALKHRIVRKRVHLLLDNHKLFRLFGIKLQSYKANCSSSSSFQDSYKIGYHYNSSQGNNIVVNATCDPSNQTYCVLTMPGIPGQLYEVTVYAIFRGVISDGKTTFHTTGKIFHSYSKSPLTGTFKNCTITYP